MANLIRNKSLLGLIAAMLLTSVNGSAQYTDRKAFNLNGNVKSVVSKSEGKNIFDGIEIGYISLTFTRNGKAATLNGDKFPTSEYNCGIPTVERDSKGQISSSTAYWTGGRATTSYTYNTQGRITSLKRESSENAGKATASCAYDADGNLIKEGKTVYTILKKDNHGNWLSRRYQNDNGETVNDSRKIIYWSNAVSKKDSIPPIPERKPERNTGETTKQTKGKTIIVNTKQQTGTTTAKTKTQQHGGTVTASTTTQQQIGIVTKTKTQQQGTKTSSTSDLRMWELKGSVKSMRLYNNEAKNESWTAGFSQQGKWITADGKQLSAVYSKFNRDTQGRVSLTLCGEYDAITQNTYTYNAQGYVAKCETDYGMDGYSKESFTYNAAGDLVKSRLIENMGYEAPDEPAVSFTYTILSRDSHGNWTRRKVSKSDGTSRIQKRVITYY